MGTRMQEEQQEKLGRDKKKKAKSIRRECRGKVGNAFGAGQKVLQENETRVQGGGEG